MIKTINWIKQHKAQAGSVIFLLFAIVGCLYLYKCYTDPLYFKSELFARHSERCNIISKYIPDGTPREYVEKILINSDGARIELNNPNSKGIEVGSIIYNLDPWTIWANDAAYVYVWYDSDNKVIGIDGTCFNGKRNPKGVTR